LRRAKARNIGIQKAADQSVDGIFSPRKRFSGAPYIQIYLSMFRKIYGIWGSIGAAAAILFNEFLNMVEDFDYYFGLEKDLYIKIPPLFL
jgi:hypothetical protein